MLGMLVSLIITLIESLISVAAVPLIIIVIGMVLKNGSPNFKNVHVLTYLNNLIGSLGSLTETDPVVRNAPKKYRSIIEALKHKLQEKNERISELETELESTNGKKDRFKGLISKLESKLKDQNKTIGFLEKKLNEFKQIHESDIDSICSDSYDPNKVEKLIVILKEEIDKRRKTEEFIAELKQIIILEDCDTCDNSVSTAGTECVQSSYSSHSSIELKDLDDYLEYIREYVDNNHDVQDRLSKAESELDDCRYTLKRAEKIERNLLLKCQKVKSFKKWKNQIKNLIDDYDHNESIYDDASSECSSKRTELYGRMDDTIRDMMGDMMQDMMDRRYGRTECDDETSTCDGHSDCDFEDDKSDDDESDLFALLTQLSTIICSCREKEFRTSHDLRILIDLLSSHLTSYNTKVVELNRACDLDYPTVVVPDFDCDSSIASITTKDVISLSKIIGHTLSESVYNLQSCEFRVKECERFDESKSHEIEECEECKEDLFKIIIRLKKVLRNCRIYDEICDSRDGESDTYTDDTSSIVSKHHRVHYDPCESIDVSKCEEDYSIGELCDSLMILTDKIVDKLKSYYTQLSKLVTDGCSTERVQRLSAEIEKLLEALAACKQEKHEIERRYERSKEKLDMAECESADAQEAMKVCANKLSECQIEKDCLARDNYKLETELKIVNLELARCKENVVAKEEYSKGLIGFLRTFLESESNSNKLKHTELISVIKSGHEFGQDMSKMFVKNYEEFSKDAIDRIDRKRKPSKAITAKCHGSEVNSSVNSTVDSPVNSSADCQEIIQEEYESVITPLLCSYRSKYDQIIRATERLVDLLGDDQSSVESESDCSNDHDRRAKELEEKIHRLGRDCDKIKSKIQDEIGNLTESHECCDRCDLTDHDICYLVESLDIPDSVYYLYLNGSERSSCYCCARSKYTYDSEEDQESVDYMREYGYKELRTRKYTKDEKCNNTDKNSDDTSSYSDCRCRTHRELCCILGKVEHAQRHIVDLLIKINTGQVEKSDIDPLKKIFEISDDYIECQTIPACFRFKLPFHIYFECYGRPECLIDVVGVDREQINKIKEDLKNKTESSSFSRICGGPGTESDWVEDASFQSDDSDSVGIHIHRRS